MLTKPNDRIHHLAVPTQDSLGRQTIQLHGGLTKKEWMATQFLAAKISSGEEHDGWEDVVNQSIGAAEALIYQLNLDADEANES